MCFGMQATEQKASNEFANTDSTGTINKVSTANPTIQNAALGNVDYATGIRDAGFQGYQGQQVASLDPMQQNTLYQAHNIANDSTGQAARALIGSYASAGPQSVSADSGASQMSPYMNQYVMNALAPQLRQMDISNAATNRATDAQATSRGAFGDSRQGVESANNAFNQNVQREGLIGNAYNNAFNTAVGAGQADANRNLQAGMANAGYGEQAIARQLGGATALQGLQSQQLGAQTSTNALAQQATAQNQAALTAQYNQWLMGQQYPFQTAGLVNSTTGAATNAVPVSTSADTTAHTSGLKIGNETKSQPNNSGLAVGGALLSAFI